ncbi:hypothetical protein [Actinocrispum wychmicini]|uniref:DUF4352 domain-containing protein n=1 Tax=Actinocrispum wychmicini TaxID=1213861 RepID=A0A4R2JYL0_9PSEU|nr:hypothetical protein [Actinocrispum wychmicini]TCO62528.1 hypothetical protein EV192_102667 [Actinocrispum wychmicini]
MRTVGLAAAACVLLALASGCGADVMHSASATEVAPVAAPPAAISDQPGRFGDRRDAGDSLMVTVSAPRSFVPGETAYPQAPRAAAFEIALENQSNRLYRPSQLVVNVATADGKPVVPLVDAAQGYPGVIGSEPLAPTKSTRLTLAFALPADPVALVVTVQPSAATLTLPAEFEGTA